MECTSIGIYDKMGGGSQMATQRKLSGGGLISIEEQGGDVLLEATRPLDGQGLYKVWIWGGGGRMLLGTMIPQGGVLQLRRRMSRGALAGRGCYPVAGGEVVMAFPFQKRGEGPPQGWRWAEHISLEDPTLRQAVAGKRFLQKEGEGVFYLAHPYDSTKEFPIIPLFCLCGHGQLGGTLHLMWKFDESGRPIVWDNL